MTPDSPTARKRSPDPERETARVAQLMMQTHGVERSRHDGQRVSDEHVPDPTRFARDFADMGTHRRRRMMQHGEIENADEHGENVERAAERLVKRPPVVQVWFDVAKIVIENRIDPEKFVRRQFSVLPSGSDSPRPEMLKTPQAIKNYRAGQRLSEHEAQVALRMQVQAFKTEVAALAVAVSCPLKGPEAWAAVLRDTDTHLSALFRYCEAVILQRDPKVKDPEPFRALAEMYRTAAAVQYVFEADAYDRIWRELLPGGWRDAADNLYRGYYGFDGGPDVPAGGRVDDDFAATDDDFED